MQVNLQFVQANYFQALMIPRQAAPLLQRLRRGYPILAITGPRQSGKTTLAKSVFQDKQYASLEDPDTRSFAAEDPRGFLGQFRDGAILDEIQRVPALFSYLQSLVDGAGIMGQFVLTGSQQFGLRSQITQSLAGRVGSVELLPFSMSELKPSGSVTLDQSEEVLFQGFYPPLYDRDLRPTDWLSDYITTYIERDVRQLLLVKDLRSFRTFMGLVAGRTAQPLNYSSLGADAGVSHNTIREWLSVLEASYIIKLVQPYHRNFSKRLIKSPMLYFLDSGLLCSLLGIRSPSDLLIHPLKGPVFETFVFSELLKTIVNRRDPSTPYFWRDHRGQEVDLLIEQSHTKVHLFECKAGKTISSSFFKELTGLATLFGESCGQSFLVYGGMASEVRNGHQVVPWHQVGGRLEALLQGW